MTDLSDKKRIFAFELLDGSLAPNVKKQINSLPKDIDNSCATIVFCHEDASSGFKEIDGIETVVVPDESSAYSKFVNFSIDSLKNANFNGFMYAMDQTLQIDKDISMYVDKLEKTMVALDYNVHLATVTDPCNYIFSKYCPRLTIDIDDEDIKSRLSLPDKLSFTSHSNTACVVFNFNAFKESSVPKFDEQFTVDMFTIIEFLARRKANRKDSQLYFMNQYLAISDEIGAFSTMKLDRNIDQETMKKEDALFKSMNINYAPDNNIDNVLDTLYVKLNQKMGKSS